MPNVIDYQTFDASRPSVRDWLHARINRKSVTAALVVVVLLAYAAGHVFGRGGRGFFSPDSLDCRTQSEILLPLTEVPLYRSSYKYHRYPLVDYLVDKGYWSANETRPPKWMMTFHWNEQWRGGTVPFHKHLGWRGSDWIKWSEAHPAIAADFWPRILRIMRDRKDPWHLRVDALLSYVQGCNDLRAYHAVLKLFEEPVTESAPATRMSSDRN